MVTQQRLVPNLLSLGQLHQAMKNRRRHSQSTWGKVKLRGLHWGDPSPKSRDMSRGKPRMGSGGN